MGAIDKLIPIVTQLYKYKGVINVKKKNGKISRKDFKTKWNNITNQLKIKKPEIVEVPKTELNKG